MVVRAVDLVLAHTGDLDEQVAWQADPSQPMIHEIEMRNDDDVGVLIAPVGTSIDAQHQNIQSGLATPDVGGARISAADSSIYELLRDF